MIALLKRIYHKLSRFAIVRWLGKVYLNGSPLANYMSYRRVKKATDKPHNPGEKIRVAFIGQCVSVWGKTAPVFEAMSQDPRFTVIIYAVKDITDKDNNNTAEYFRGKYDNVIAVGSDGKEDGLPLKKWCPDYVFFTRPYDQYLPLEYRSHKVSEFAKVCYFSYSFMLTYNSLSFSFPKCFARNLYLFFAENEYLREYNEKRFKTSHRKRIRRSVFIGYPIMERFQSRQKEEKSPWFSVLWTPRWQTSDEIGGSSFFDYKDLIGKVAEDENSIRLIFRPHPLTFSNFVKTGEMTENEVGEYLSQFTGERKLYDRSGDYAQTFENADVMLSDISSMIPEFYISKKPIIYCERGAQVLPVISRLLEGCYVSHSWEETEEYIRQLSNGKDPLKEKRSRICDEVFGKDLNSITVNVMELIVKDCMDRS
ncbi:MAG: CDP-glycerol glycerophosphotransferase family protein [Lachnospiraceae bacterium]|nr:CDP-glycerol glycerophosphotransferase family protein [Lachnospiraceae bacterium]